MADEAIHNSKIVISADASPAAQEADRLARQVEARGYIPHGEAVSRSDALAGVSRLLARSADWWRRGGGPACSPDPQMAGPTT